MKAELYSADAVPAPLGDSNNRPPLTIVPPNSESAMKPPLA